MSDSYSLTDARTHLPELLNRVAEGEEITIVRFGKPVAVIVGHDRWVKTARYEVLEQAKRLHDQLKEFKKLPPPEPLTGSKYDAESHIAWLREDDDPWNELSHRDD